MHPASEKAYCFAGYTLDQRRGCLRAGDREIELRPKSFALLCYLVENAGRLVPKDELVKAVWPNVLVTDESLTRCVSDVRLGLNDGGQCIIKTVPRRGYLLATPVSRLEPQVTAPSQDREPDAARPRRAERRLLTITAIFMAAALATIAFWWLRSGDISPSPTVIPAMADKPESPAPLITAVGSSAALAKLATQTAPRMSIVVLPFTNLSGDPNQEYFADGFSEDLTTDLSHIPGSFVIASTSANTYKGKALSGKEIASELGVRYVLEGGVRKAGDHVRVNAKLIDGETGAHLWAQRYDRDSADFMRVQDEITSQISNVLEMTLTQSESERSYREHPSNPDSLDLTLRANAMSDGPGSPEINENARRLYEHAVELDPKNAAAFVGLAMTYVTDVEENWVTGLSNISEAIKRADDAVSRALSINPQFASAYQAKSEILAYSMQDDYRGEIAQAIEAAETAFQLDPNNSSTAMWLGRLYTKAGHPERTRAFVEQSIRLNPRNSPSNSLYNLGMSQLVMGHYEEAIEIFQKSLLQQPRKLISWGGLTGALYASGREVEAKNALVKWREIAVTDEGYNPSGDSTDRDIFFVRLQVALIRLGRWPFAVDLVVGPGLSRALFKFQADENLPRTGQPDEATLARLGMPSQVKAITERVARSPVDRW